MLVFSSVLALHTFRGEACDEVFGAKSILLHIVPSELNLMTHDSRFMILIRYRKHFHVGFCAIDVFIRMRYSRSFARFDELNTYLPP